MYNTETKLLGNSKNHLSVRAIEKREHKGSMKTEEMEKGHVVWWVIFFNLSQSGDETMK